MRRFLPLKRVLAGMMISMMLLNGLLDSTPMYAWATADTSITDTVSETEENIAETKESVIESQEATKEETAATESETEEESIEESEQNTSTEETEAETEEKLSETQRADETESKKPEKDHGETVQEKETDETDAGQKTDETKADQKETQESGQEESTEETSESETAMKVLGAALPIRRLAARSYSRRFDPSVLPSGTKANVWQIMRGGYTHEYVSGTDVSAEYDSKSNVTYSDNDTVRMTKNVISTDTENEFIMFFKVEPQVSWEEILQLNTVRVSNNNHPLGHGEYPSGGKGTNQLSPVKTGEYTTPVRFVYYANVNGKQVVLARPIMYSNASKVPNGGIGIGNPLLSESPDKAFYSSNNFNLKEGGGENVSELWVDISTLYNKYSFSMEKVYAKKVRDKVGQFQHVYTDSFNYDGGTCDLEDGVIAWDLPGDDLGILPYTQGSDGLITPSGVLRKLSNGKATYYRENAYRMSYKFSLDVTEEGFVSCDRYNSPNDITADYAVQTNHSPDAVKDKNKGGKLTYETGNTTGTGDFRTPYIKGLLYDLEFTKLLKNDVTPLKGIKFSVTRIVEGTSYSEKKTYSAEDITDDLGRIKFHNMPWGRYEVKEISFAADGPDKAFQETYLNEELPRTFSPVKIGQVINGGALVDDHYLEAHNKYRKVDLKSDERNQLYPSFDGDGIVENKTYTAKITIEKEVRYYDKISDADLKSMKYEMEISSGDVYRKWDSDSFYSELYKKNETKPDTEPSATDFYKMNFPQGKNRTIYLPHQGSRQYDLMVPKNGGTISLMEIIDDAYSERIALDSIELNGTKQKLTGPGANKVSVQVKPGDDLKITVRNTPVGRVKVKKVIDNYRDELADDAFIVKADLQQTTGDKESGKTEFVLTHNETSPTLEITETSRINLSEILPKEYALVRMEADGGSLSGQTLVVDPGQDVTVTVHNRFTAEPYFHVSDAVFNLFKHVEEGDEG